MKKALLVLLLAGFSFNGLTVKEQISVNAASNFDEVIELDSSNENSVSTCGTGPDIEIVDDENVDGNVMSTGEGGASTCGTGPGIEIVDDENVDGNVMNLEDTENE